jgi:hypothetical protein
MWASFDRERYQIGSRTAAGQLLFFSACLRQRARSIPVFSRSYHAVICVYDDAA